MINQLTLRYSFDYNFSQVGFDVAPYMVAHGETDPSWVRTNRLWMDCNRGSDANYGRDVKAMTQIIVTILLLLLHSTPAHAYLDPGSGSYMFQLMIASLAGAVFAVKTYWVQIKNFFKKLFHKSPL